MNWNDYEAVWKRQPLPRGVDAELATIRDTFESQSRKMAATLRVRDWSELGACVFVVSFLAWFWWKVGPAGWPLSVAIVLILSVAGRFLRERLRARRNRLGPDASLLAKIDADLAELRYQRQMVLKLWLWYLGPCALAMCIQGWVIVRRSPIWSPLREPLMLGGFGAFFALVFLFAWTINHRALKKRIEPRIDELEKLRRDLLSSK